MLPYFKWLRSLIGKRIRLRIVTTTRITKHLIDWVIFPPCIFSPRDWFCWLTWPPRSFLSGNPLVAIILIKCRPSFPRWPGWRSPWWPRTGRCPTQGRNNWCKLASSLQEIFYFCRKIFKERFLRMRLPLKKEGRGKERRRGRKKVRWVSIDHKHHFHHFGCLWTNYHLIVKEIFASGDCQSNYTQFFL